MKMTDDTKELIQKIKDDKALTDIQRAAFYNGFQKELQHQMRMSGPMSADTLFDCAATEATLKFEIKLILDGE